MYRELCQLSDNARAMGWIEVGSSAFMPFIGVFTLRCPLGHPVTWAMKNLGGYEDPECETCFPVDNCDGNQ